MIATKFNTQTNQTKQTKYIHDAAASIIQGDCDTLWEQAKQWPQPTYDNLAFLVYSSGTTGQPKGIANPHAAPALSYQWRFGSRDYTSKDIVACNVYFVWECLRPVMRGAALLPIPADVIYDADLLTQMLQKHKVTEMLFTPSLIENALLTLDPKEFQERMKSLTTVFLNGEVVSMQLRKRCLERLPHIRFINLYSISECHEVGAVDLTSIDPNLSPKFCPVGPPADVSNILILDDNQKPVGNGEAGELYVSGDMLARGYLNLPEMTDSRFLKNPFDPEGGRMYRTGDRARLLDNGHLEILGRCDFMVKIRGYSIVLGAVEAALVDAVCLTSCVVVADGEEGDDKHLVAYIVRDTDPKEGDTRLASWTVDSRTGACPEIRRAVDGLLPHYMVPSVFIEVETLPVNQVGAKLDRKALQAQTADRRTMLRSLQNVPETHNLHAQAPAPGASESSEIATILRLVKYLRLPKNAPIQDVEATMILLWEKALDKEPGMISLDSEFHEQGGHSLSAARLAALVNKVFEGSKVSATQVFRDNATVKHMCNQVMTANINSPKRAALLKKTAVVSEPEPAPSKETNEDSGSQDTKDSSSASWSVLEAAHSEDEEKILQQVKDDSVLPVDLVIPQATGGVSDVVTLKDARSVFLTGATGFLGAHLLAEILKKNTTATVLCLVRSKDPNAVKNNLDKYSLSVNMSRVVAVNGDLSLPHFGLNHSDWNRVVANVDAVVHCAASVSLTATYDTLKPANVNGTLNAIRLVASCHAGASLVYVSSNGIYPTDKGPDEVFLENDDVACLPGRLGAWDGYGLSKWAAERLVCEAHSNGLPCVVMRYGNIGWHSKTGNGNALDFQGMLLSGCMRMQKRPDVNNWTFEVTPVDFAASALITIGGDQELLANGAIFNCVQDGFTPSTAVFQWLDECRGTSTKPIPLGAWQQEVADAASDSDDKELTALFAFSSGLVESYLNTKAYLDCSKLDAALAKLDPSLVRKGLASKEYYARFFGGSAPSSIPATVSTSTFMEDSAVPVDPQATGAPTGPLARQVVVVTGASSGIGRAIVQSLVQAGCHVAMGARRLHELEKTRELVAKACPGSACKTLIMTTDVTERQQVEALMEQAEMTLGPVDILVNVAGVMYFTLMKNVIWDQWERTVDVNCKGTMYGIGSVLPNMLARGKGHIVNITSDAGRKGFPGLAVYSGSKFFTEGMSQALRSEIASSGVRVTCVQPGNVETPLLSTSTDAEGLKEYGTPTGAKVLEPADIGRAVVYAVTQPEWCAVNEILVEPREEPA